MKSEVIEDILNVEAEAEKIVNDANEHAHDILFDAQSKAKSIIAKRVEEERVKANSELADANKALSEHLEEYEKERVRIEEASSLLPDSVIRKASERVIDRIISID